MIAGAIIYGASTMGAADRYEAEERERHRAWVRSLPLGRRCLHEAHTLVIILVIGLFWLLIGAPSLLWKLAAQFGLIEKPS